MPNRAATFVSAILASFLAAPFTVSQGAVAAADTCLVSPKNQAPEGSHWFYRIEHPSNRHCWYLRGGQTAATTTSASAGLTSAANAMPGSVANARAELTSRGNEDANISGQVPAATAGPVASADNTSASVQDTTVSRSLVAARWPDQMASNAAIATAADRSHNSAPNVVTPPPSAVVPLTAADALPAKPSGSIQMLIIAIVGALSVAGLAASAVGFNGRRNNQSLPIDGERRAIWETTLADGPLPSPFAAASRPQLGIPRELHEAEDPDDKIAQMLVRLARSAQA